MKPKAIRSILALVLLVGLALTVGLVLVPGLMPAMADSAVPAGAKVAVHEQPIGGAGDASMPVGGARSASIAAYAAFDNPNYYYATIKNAPDGTFYRQAGLSPDGTKIVAQKSWNDGTYDRTETVLMNADGSGEIIITPGDSGQGDIQQYGNPFWSDDGAAIGIVEAHIANANKVMVYSISGGTRSYIYEPSAPNDVSNPDFLGSSKTSIVFWAYGVGGSVADLFTWDGTTLTNITSSADYKEYEPVSNADGTKIVYWSGETTAEPVDTTHTLTYSGGTWNKDVGFTPIADTYWGYWTTSAATKIALTVVSTGDVSIYNSAGTFVADLSGPGYSGGSGQKNFFGSMPQGPNGEYAITSNAGRSVPGSGRDIVIAAPRAALYVDDDGSDANPGTQAAPFKTIQKGIDAVFGSTVNVAAGTYPGALTLNKPLKLIGAGSASTHINGDITIVAAASGLAGNPTLIQGLDINTAGGNGISVANAESVAHLAFVGLTFTGNVIDAYFENTSLMSPPSTADDIVFDGCAFSGTGKGIYAEKLSNAVIKNSTFTNVGNASVGYYGQAVDINLKWGDYSNILIDNCTFTNSGTSDGSVGVGGSAIGIKARGTGADSSYAARPATLAGVTVSNCTITGGQRGIRLGEPGKGNTGPTNVTFSHNTFSGIPNTPTGSGTPGAVVNATTAETNAEHNYWGTVVFSEIAPEISGSVDWSPWCNSDFTACTYAWPVHNVTQGIDYQTIQAAIDAATAGDTINVAAGTYNEGITINKNNLTITGAGAASTTIVGPLRAAYPGGNTVLFAGSTGSTLQGFTITRAGNDLTNWASNQQDQGVNLSSPGGNTLQNCILKHNRNAIYLSSAGNSILNNTIDDNRTGIHISDVGGNNIIRGNLITNNWTIGILYRQGPSYTGDVITNNTITGNWYSQVEDRGNPSGVVRNLQGNWFGPAPFTIVQQANSGEPGGTVQIPVEFGGTATPPASTPTFVVNVLDPNPSGDPMGRGNANPVRLAYSPWLSTGANSVPAGTPGFQGDFSALNVDAVSAQFGGTAIQRGIDMVSGSTVNVAAGTYVEDLLINKAVTLLGPNAGINPNTGTRGAEAVIISALTDPDPSGGCQLMVYVKVSDVTIKGFTFDGDNPALTSGTIIDGADVDACELVSGYEGVGNIVVENNILKHSTYSGIQFYNYTNPAATAGNYIRYNRFEDIGETAYAWGMGVLIYNNFYADITDNVMTGVRTGVQTGNYSAANPGTTGSISNNQIGVWRLGIFHNLAYGSASPFTISGNTITAETYPGATKWNGVLLSSIEGAVNATITNNDIVIPGTVSFTPPGYTAGYNVWNVTTTAPIAISGGTVTGGDYGVFVNNYEGYSSNADNTAVKIDGVTALGSAIAGVYVKDSPSNTNGATVYADIQNCTLDTNATGILVDGADATAKANKNKIAGNPTAGVTNTSGVLMDAELNWWGSACGPSGVGPGNGDAVSTNVDYSPWWAAPDGSSTASEGAPGTLVIPTGATTATQQAILNCAVPGSTITFATNTAPYAGGIVVNTNALTLNLNSNTFGPGSSWLTVNADDLTVLGPGVLDGNGDTNSAIVVNGGADNFTLKDAEVREWANGVDVAGSVASLKIVGNWIHDNTGAGLKIASLAAVGGVVNIEGNLFKDNGGNGIQNDGTTDPLKAEYNSWGHLSGPASGDGVSAKVDATPFTFTELFIDVDPPAEAVERHVVETTSFDVKLVADAAKLSGLTFKFTYDPARLQLNSTTFAGVWGGTTCTSLSSTPGVVAYRCQLFAPAAEWDADGGTIATFNFTALAGPIGPGPWTTYFDIAHAQADTSAGAVGGVKIYVNNAGFDAPSITARDITDTDDGKIIIDGLANYTGYVDLQSRTNENGAVLKVYNQQAKSGAILLARGSSAAGGSYTTAYEAGKQLIINTTYWLVIDRDLYLPTTAMATTPSHTAIPTDWQHSKLLDTRPLTSLVTVVLLGGDATNNDGIDINDASCIGGDYAKTSGFTACGAPVTTGGTSDVNGDGVVNILDLSLMGGNFYENSSPWTP